MSRAERTPPNPGLAIAFVVIALLLPGSAYATAQAADSIVVNGESYALTSNPLSPYLVDRPDLLPKSKVISSGNWRGYIAEWEISDKHLLLTDVFILVSHDQPKSNGARSGYESVYDDMFPDSQSITANWYTGHLIIPTGKQVQYVHMGYASTYKKYLIARIVAGEVIELRKAKLRQFKKFRLQQFEAFKKTHEYSEAVAELLEDEDWTEKEAEEFLFQYASERYLSMVFAEEPFPVSPVVQPSQNP